MKSFVGADHVVGRPEFHGFSEDWFAVILIQDHDIFAAATGLDGEAPGLVIVNLASG